MGNVITLIVFINEKRTNMVKIKHYQALKLDKKMIQVLGQNCPDILIQDNVFRRFIFPFCLIRSQFEKYSLKVRSSDFVRSVF